MKFCFRKKWYLLLGHLICLEKSRHAFWPEGLMKICSNVLEEEEIVSCKNLCIPLYFRIRLVGGSRNLGIFLEL